MIFESLNVLYVFVLSRFRTAEPRAVRLKTL